MRIVKALVAVLVVAAAFGGGYVLARRSSGSGSARTSERKVLYWVDPMHPAYKSDKPGIAPDCGMKLEPVYADGAAPAAAAGQSQGKLLYYRDPQKQAYHSTGRASIRKPAMILSRCTSTPVPRHRPEPFISAPISSR